MLCAFLGGILLYLWYDDGCKDFVLLLGGITLIIIG